MNDIRLICNYMYIGIYYTSEKININEKLKSFSSSNYDIKICNESLVFVYKYNAGGYSHYEVIESDPDMTPEQLYNYWRLIYG